MVVPGPGGCTFHPFSLLSHPVPSSHILIIILAGEHWPFVASSFSLLGRSLVLPYCFPSCRQQRPHSFPYLLYQARTRRSCRSIGDCQVWSKIRVSSNCGRLDDCAFALAASLEDVGFLSPHTPCLSRPATS